MSSAFLLHFKCNFFAYSPFSWLTSIYCVYILLRALTFLAVLSFERNLNHFAQCSFIHIINFPLFPASLAYSSFGQKTSTTDGLARRCLQFFLRVSGRFSSPCTFSLFRFYPPPPALVSFCVCFALCFYICFLCRFNGTFAAFIRFSSWKICGPSSSDFPCIFRRAPLAFQSIFHARASSVSIQLSMHQSTDNAQNFTSATSVFHSSAPKKKNSICYLIVAVVAVIAPQSAGFDPLWAKLVS